jgi:hypothetical protein
MELPPLADVLPALALALALAACAGLRAWLPLLLAGALARVGVLELGPSYAFLAGNRALPLLGLASLIEITADKLPVVDHALDLLSSVLRPAAGALLAASVLGRVADPLTSLVLGLAVGAPAALVPHAAKAGVRVVSTTFSAGLASPVLSLIEDVLTVVGVGLAVLLPLLVAGGLALLAFLVLRRLGVARPTLRVS